MMAHRGHAGAGGTDRGQIGGATGTGLGEGRLHGGSEDSTTHTAPTYGPGDFPDTPHRFPLSSSSTRHPPLVVNDATLMIESTDDDHHRMMMSMGESSHVSGYIMGGSIPEAGHSSSYPLQPMLCTLCTLSYVPSPPF